MYFQKSESIANEYHDLADVTAFIDRVLDGAKDVACLRPEQLARSGKLDVNLVASVLDLYAEDPAFEKRDVVACENCPTVTRVDAILLEIEENGKFVCSSCESEIELRDLRNLVPVSVYFFQPLKASRISNTNKTLGRSGTLPDYDSIKSVPNAANLSDSNEHHWFDDLPLKYDEKGARTALRLLQRAYDNASALEQVAKLAGIQVGQINFNQAAGFLPMQVLDQAAKEGRTVNLLAEVLMDRASAGIHDEMWKNLGDGAARVHHVALLSKADFDRVAALPSPTTTIVNGSPGDLQRIVNVLSQFSDSAMLRFELAQREARVVRIDIAGKGTGTGWLVAPDILLTAYHVIEPSVNDMSKIIARFDYKFVPQLGGKLLANGRQIKFAANNPILARSGHADKVIELSKESATDTNLLDFALLRLEEKVGEQGLGPNGQGDEKRGWFQLPTDVHIFHPDEGLFVLGHPQLKNDVEAGPLKLTLALPSAAELTEHANRVRYSVNTKGGNSGSPVMNQSLMPLALHHAGSEGTPLWDTNQRWTGGFNQGIPLNLIVAEIHKQLDGSPILKELSI